MKFVMTALLWPLLSGAMAQYIPRHQVQENAIRSVSYRYENKRTLIEHKNVYDQEGQLVEEYNCHSNTAFETYTKNFYEGNSLVKSLHYRNGVLHDSTVHQFRWDEVKREFEEKKYLVASGKSETTIQTFDYPRYALKALNNDTLDWEDHREHYKLNDSTEAIVNKTILYNRAPHSIIASNDSVVCQNIRNGFMETRWSEGTKVESEFTDTLAKIRIEYTYNKKGEITSFYRYAIGRNRYKTKIIDAFSHNQYQNYEYRTSEKDGTTIEETLIYNDRHKVIKRNVKSITERNGMRYEETVTYGKRNRMLEKEVFVYNSKNLLMEDSSYNNKGELLGRQTYEYTYF